MVYNPNIPFAPYTSTLPDESALLSPAYRNPFFFRQEGQQAPAPYYNPFQGSYASAPSIHQATAPVIEPEVVRQGATRLIADSNNDSDHEAVQGGWTTAAEVEAAIESGWYGTYKDARDAINNPKANKFTDLVDKHYTERGKKADPFAIDPNYGKINPTGILSGLGRIAQELGLSNAYGSGAIGTGDPVIGNPAPTLSSETIQAGTLSTPTAEHQFMENYSAAPGANEAAATRDTSQDYSDSPSVDNSEHDSTGGGQGDSYGGLDFNEGGMVPMYKNYGGPIYRPDGSIGPEGINPPLATALAPQQAPAAPMAAPMPTPPMRMSFADKVAKAKSVIEKNKADSMPLPTPMMDAEGDGGVMGDVTYADHSVGPDMGSDTVDAKLTPGEFVMNKEATEMYGPEIEKMNQDGLIARNMGGSVPYYDEGGYVSKLNKLMEMDPENAPAWDMIKTKYFQDGTEKPIGYQAPRGAINKLGQSLVSIGQNDFKGASEALTPTTTGGDLTSKLAEIDALVASGQLTEQQGATAKNKLTGGKIRNKEDDAKLFTKVSRIGQEAISYVDLAAPAIEVAQSVATGKLATTAIIAASAKGADVNTINLVKNQFVIPALKKAVEKDEITAENMEAYNLMVSSITALTTVALKAQGPGPKTDFDFQVAAKETANLEGGTPQTIKAQLGRLVENANTELAALGVQPPAYKGSPNQETLIAKEKVVKEEPITYPTDQEIKTANIISGDSKVEKAITGTDKGRWNWRVK